MYHYLTLDQKVGHKDTVDSMTGSVKTFATVHFDFEELCHARSQM